MKFDETQIAEPLKRAVKDMGFDEMTPIQEQAIPLFLSGRDIIGQARTGTGKTAAFGLPILQMVDPTDRKLQAMVICPTRELAVQIVDEMHKYSKYTEGVRIVAVYGGQEIFKQVNALKGGAQVVVGTPGRIMDHMRRHTIKTETMKIVVLDEADEMLRMGFREDIETILTDAPENRQMGLFSATMPQPILDITGKYQHDAVMVKVSEDELTVPAIKQYVYEVKRENRQAATLRLIDAYNLKKVLIFCNTKLGAAELASWLKSKGVNADALHGDLTQYQRDNVLLGFREGKTEVMVATDVAARGLDIADVQAVINYELPLEIPYYVHRIGRTGRAGADGMAFSFIYGRDRFLKNDIERLCQTQMELCKLPDAKAVLDSRISHLGEEIQNIDSTSASGYLEALKNMTGLSDGELAAALLTIAIGEKPEELPDDSWKPRENHRRRRGFGGSAERRFGSGEESSEDRRERHKDRKRGVRFVSDEEMAPAKAESSAASAAVSDAVSVENASQKKSSGENAPVNGGEVSERKVRRERKDREERRGFAGKRRDEERQDRRNRRADRQDEELREGREEHREDHGTDKRRNPRNAAQIVEAEFKKLLSSTQKNRKKAEEIEKAARERKHHDADYDEFDAVPVRKDRRRMSASEREDRDMVTSVVDRVIKKNSRGESSHGGYGNHYNYEDEKSVRDVRMDGTPAVRKGRGNLAKKHSFFESEDRAEHKSENRAERKNENRAEHKNENRAEHKNENRAERKSEKNFRGNQKGHEDYSERGSKNARGSRKNHEDSDRRQTFGGKRNENGERVFRHGGTRGAKPGKRK